MTVSSVSDIPSQTGSPQAPRADMGEKALGDTTPGSQPVAKTSTGRKRVFFILKLVISATLIGWILWGADLAAVGRALAGVDPAWLALALCLQGVGAAIVTLRWQGLLAAKGIRPSFGYLFASTLSAGFFRQFMPSIVGGDIIRGYDAWRAGAAPGLAAVSLMLDRLFGLMALLLFAVIALALSGDLSQRIPFIWLWLAMGGGALVLLLVAMTSGQMSRLSRLSVHLAGPVASRLGKIGNGLRMYRGEGPALRRAFALSILLQINVVGFYWVLSLALGLGLDYAIFYVIVPIAIFVMMAPITINGVGLRETVFVFLLGLWAVDGAHALAFAWLEYGAFLAFGLIGGVVHALRGAPARPIPEEAAGNG